MDVIPQSEYQTLINQASKHSRFETFRDEILKLAESLWHHARADGLIQQEEQDVEAVLKPADPGQVSIEKQPEQEVTPEAPVITKKDEPVAPVQAAPVEQAPEA